jgi:hypothetical protein
MTMMISLWTGILLRSPRIYPPFLTFIYRVYFLGWTRVEEDSPNRPRRETNGKAGQSYQDWYSSLATFIAFSL